MKTYWIVAPDTAVDCLKAVVRNPEVRIDRGQREAEHDVGFGSSADYDHYNSLDAFFASGDYERYAGTSFISSYSFLGTFQGKPIEISFADKGIMTLSCHEESIDLCSIIEDVK